MQASAPDIEADFNACRAAIRAGSKSFFAASLLLPQKVRGSAYALYAFCRRFDDAIDVDGGDAAAVSALRTRLDAIYSGAPGNSAVDRAFAAVVANHELPKILPGALIEGLAWDAAGRRYQSIEALYDYCARVAGSVGAMMSVVMGVRDTTAIARACDLGVAMQLTNIARDVGEDARAGRLYLPIDWMIEAAVDPDAFLRAPAFSPEIAMIVRRLLAEASHYYERGLTGVDFLPMNCRASIVAAADIYAEIGQVIAANGHDSINVRAVVSTRRKLAHLANAFAGMNFAARTPHAAPLPANKFLVDAVKPVRAATAAATTPAERVIDLIMRLEGQKPDSSVLRSPSI